MNPQEQNQASSIFTRIVTHFEAWQTVKDRYKPITLITLLEKEISEKSGFLGLFFEFTGKNLFTKEGEEQIGLGHVLSLLDGFASWGDDETKALNESLAAFAQFLMNNFFIPLKSSGVKTPHVTPSHVSRVMTPECGIGTPQRLRNLRKNCLVRGRHRCAVTGKFDAAEAEKRFERDDQNAKDDHGNALGSEDESFATLEVAHIIPHSFLSLSDEEGGRKLTESKQIAYMILEMFNPTAVELINGQNIDRPVNALSMTIELHRLLGDFKIAFERIGPPGSHSYRVDYVNPGHRVRTEKLPVTVSLPLTPERDIDPPSPELLAIHRAIAPSRAFFTLAQQESTLTSSFGTWRS